MTYLVLRLIFSIRYRWSLIRVALGKEYRPILDASPPKPPARAVKSGRPTGPAVPSIAQFGSRPAGPIGITGSVGVLPVDEDPFFPRIHDTINRQLRDVDIMYRQATELGMEDVKKRCVEIADGIHQSRARAYQIYRDRREREERLEYLNDRIKYLNDRLLNI